MNRKRIAKRCLKMFGYKLPVKWFTDYAIEYDPDDTTTPICLYIQRPNQTIPSQLMKVQVAQRKYFKGLLLPVSYDLFAILHEIGHLESEQTDYDNYVNDLDLLENLYKKDLIDANQYIYFYNQIENEKNADNWAINWIKNNENTAKMLNSLLN